MLEQFIYFTTYGISVNAKSLKEWCEVTNNTLSPWDYKLLIEMNAVFKSFLKEASKPECPNPLLSEIENKRRIGQELLNTLRKRVKKG